MTAGFGWHKGKLKAGVSSVTAPRRARCFCHKSTWRDTFWRLQFWKRHRYRLKQSRRCGKYTSVISARTLEYRAGSEDVEVGSISGSILFGSFRSFWSGHGSIVWKHTTVTQQTNATERRATERGLCPTTLLSFFFSEHFLLDCKIHTSKSKKQFLSFQISLKQRQRLFLVVQCSPHYRVPLGSYYV